MTTPDQRALRDALALFSFFDGFKCPPRIIIIVWFLNQSRVGFVGEITLFV